MLPVFRPVQVVALTAVITVLSFGTARAETSEPKLLGTFGDWSSYSFVEGGKKVCYMLSSPKKSTGNYKKRGEIFALVTHRPSEKTRNVFSYMAGYSYKTDSVANLSIDKQKFALFTHNDTAWAPDTATDNRIAEALRKGASMTISGSSSKGTATTDTLGLKGTGDAFKAIDTACPVE